MPRRLVLKGGLAGLAALMAKPLLTACGSNARSEGSGGSGPIAPELRSNLAALGELGAIDANGLRLPPGVTSRVVAHTGDEPIVGSGFEWHTSPDGGATFATPDGGWIYVSNSEFPLAGGASALRFAADGTLANAYSILEKTNSNCAGGKTPWGTWLSCEEAARGRVFECDPFGQKAAIARLALGIFAHEAVAVDPKNQRLYLTEDEGDGCFYRFVPAALGKGRADLGAGSLEVAEILGDGSVVWHAVPDPQFEAAVPTRLQVSHATKFDGGEGIAYFEGVIYFSTKGDNRIWAYDIENEKLGVLYDAAKAANPILTGVDNLTVSCCGDVLVAEDGGDMQVVAIMRDGTLKPLVQVVGHDGSEVTGIAFDPSGTRLYLSSQRGIGKGGITYELNGPFHLPA